MSQTNYYPDCCGHEVSLTVVDSWHRVSSKLNVFALSLSTLSWQFYVYPSSPLSLPFCPISLHPVLHTLHCVFCWPVSVPDGVLPPSTRDVLSAATTTATAPKENKSMAMFTTLQHTFSSAVRPSDGDLIGKYASGPKETPCRWALWSLCLRCRSAWSVVCRHVECLPGTGLCVDCVFLILIVRPSRCVAFD